MLLTYNVVMALADFVALRFLWRTPSLTRWLVVVTLFALFAVGAAAVIVRAGLAQPHLDVFYVVRLLSAAIFLHGTIGLVASALIFWSARRRLAGVFLLLATLLCLLAFDMWIVEPTWLEVSTVEIASSKIARPIRVVVVADLQTAAFGDYERGVLQLAFEQKPDLVLWAGDYIQTVDYQAQLLAVNAYLHEHDYRAPLGSFAVRGNVDSTNWAEMFAETSIEPVERTQEFDLDGLRLTCLSLGDSFNPRLAVGGHESDDATADDRYHIVLGHIPSFALGQVEADLLLAGHTHGGQVRLPFVGALTSNCHVPWSWAAGSTTLPSGNRLIVSRGIGMERGHAPQIRLLCRPQLLIIDLKPKQP